MISVLVLAENRKSTLARCLKAIAQQGIEEGIEILIMNMGAVDWDGQLTDYPGSRLLSCPGMHPAEARNLALQVATGEILCFTNGSCIPNSDWIEKLTAPLVNKSVVGVKGAYESLDNGWMARFIQLEHEMKYERLQGRPAIDFVDMYSAAYRRQVLLANDGFDERFGRLEEQELSYRLAGRGYRLVFQREALVRHQHDTAIWAYASWKATVGYWKAQVNRHHPDRAVSDSYTPQTLRLQIGSLFVAVLSALLLPFNQYFLIGILVAMIMFVATMIPFISFAWPKDRSVAVIAVPLLAVRALALATGYAWGILRPPPQLAGKTQPTGGINYLIKRLIDIVGSAIGLALTGALAPVLAILIKVDSSGPVFFRQRRVGQGGRDFVMYKFRTMEVNAEERLGEFLEIQDLDSPAFKLIDDPRITRVGRFLRRWSLDELPQFWNVLLGEMSLVGPRPEEKQFVAKYSDWHRERLEAKPGLTGPMQIHGRANLSMDERVQLDIDYIQAYTLWRDMKILALTIPSLLKGEGAR